MKHVTACCNDPNLDIKHHKTHHKPRILVTNSCNANISNLLFLCRCPCVDGTCDVRIPGEGDVSEKGQVDDSGFGPVDEPKLISKLMGRKVILVES